MELLLNIFRGNSFLYSFNVPRCPNALVMSQQKSWSQSGPYCWVHSYCQGGRNVINHVVRGPYQSKAIGGLHLRSDVCEGEDNALLWETCVTHTLPPALTLEQALESLKEIIEKLKLHAPHTRSGIERFQIAVPPAPKAFNWFCCQSVSSEVFPQFFLSRETRNHAYNSFQLSKTRGVFGVGAAASFSHSSFMRKWWSTIKRYYSIDSALIKPYGVISFDFDAGLPLIQHEIGSLFSFIPHIELEEHDNLSILSLTLAWSESLHFTFEDAVCSCESSLDEANDHFQHPFEKSHKRNLSSLRSFNAVEDKNVQMVYWKDLLPTNSGDEPDFMELNKSISCRQFCIRISQTFVVANNMFNNAAVLSCISKPYGNINFVWASLIIEECVRLGMMYFCIAPGSRSSALTIAASSNPFATCIVCYDERSLAFHAIGYARGSRKPAVVITSSGTAVSNLLPAVVEASQDFVPLLLLTADRPPELQNTGANQAIDQVFVPAICGVVRPFLGG